MDSVTQIVLGVAVSNAALGKKIGNRSIVYGGVLGTLPDLDVWVGRFFSDPLSAVEIHRGFSHSVLFFAVLSALVAFIMVKREQKYSVSYREAFRASFFILITHAVLDAFTTWGTQLFWPLSDKIALKSIFVIDPLYTLPFAVFLILSLTKKKEDKKRYVLNNSGLLVSTCYLISTLFLQHFVKAKTINFLDDKNIPYKNLTVKPSAFNTVLWNISIEDTTGFYLSDYSFFDKQPLHLTYYPKNEKAIQHLRNEPVIKRLKAISENQYIITGINNEIYFNDLRFGLLKSEHGKEQFAFAYRLYYRNGKWQAAELPKKREDGKLLLKKLVNRVKGN